MARSGYDISSVPERSWPRAIAFIAGGRLGGLFAQQRARAFSDLATSRGSANVRIWWARRWRRCRAAAMTVANVGCTAMIYFSAPDNAGVAGDALPDVLTAACDGAFADGLTLVQSLQAPRAAEAISALQAAGFALLADLVYMELPLGDDLPAPADDQLSWRSYGQFSETDLAAMIESSYEGSCDCPALRGRRATEDIISGHKHSGTFWAEGWLMAYQDATPVGCVLVNTSPADRTADVAYLGVAAGFRRKGVGRQLIRRAAREAYRAGWRTLTLAADVANVAAMELYRAEGFCRTHRRAAYVRFADADDRGRKTVCG